MAFARNPKTSNIVNAQDQRTPNSSSLEGASPMSMEFNFPFGGSPHGSSNSGIDAPVELRLGTSQNRSARGSAPDNARRSAPELPQTHRGSLASIDSAFDHDMLNSGNVQSWNASNSNIQPPSNSDDSPRKTDNDTKKDPKPVDDDDDDDKPAWSELKTKAGKERKRLPLACIACRRKKIRCSGEKPACKHCLRARVPCVYKVTTRKAAPRTDYMAMLDKRLKRMEDRVIKVIPKEELPDLSITGRASVRPPLPGNAPKKEKSASTKKRTADDAFTQEMIDWTQSRQRATVLDPAAGLKKQREGENKLFIEGSESLPPQHIQEHLAEVFFDHVYGQSYLLLHKPSFMRKLKAGTVPPVLILAVCAISARFSTHPHVNTEPAFLRGEQWATPARRIIEKRHYEPNITILIAMIMLGLHYFGTCEGGLSWSFGGQAMRMGYALQLHRELDHDPLGRNQIAGKSPSADLSKAGVKPPELSFIDREIRRRTMWACYLMDTFNSSGTERPSFLNEDYFQIQLPIKESHFQMEVAGPTEDINGSIPFSSRQKHNPISSDNTALANEAKSNMGVGAYIIRAVVLWKKIVKYLNLGGKERDPHPIWDPLSEFASLTRATSALKASLPSDLLYNPSNLATHASSRLANQYLTLHIIIAQTNLFLHRFAIPTYPSARPHHHHLLASGMPKLFLTSSAQSVIDSAAAISTLISDSTGHTLTLPFAGYCAYASATVHVWGIFSRSATLEASSKENLSHNYKYLARMKRYWGMFHYMAESVKDTYRAFADAAVGKNGNSASSSLGGNLLAGTGKNDPGSLSREGSVGIGVTSSTQTQPQSKSQPRQRASSTDPPSPTTLPTTSASTPPSASTTSSSATTTKPPLPPPGSQMFQYGDWFDKYPHGVSESEWESAHLEFRTRSDPNNPNISNSGGGSGGQGGSEAVMSARSELQSVEEFFASLTTGSGSGGGKNDDAVDGKAKTTSTGEPTSGNNGGRNKKVPRRRGKSFAEAHNSSSASAAAAATKKAANRKAGESRHNSISIIPSSSGNDTSETGVGDFGGMGRAGTAAGGRNHPHSNSAPQIDLITSGFGSTSSNNNRASSSALDMPFDFTSPTLYQTPQMDSFPTSNPNFGFGNSGGNGNNFNFFPHSVPNLDRQMVFGAYAGIEPSSISSNQNQPMMDLSGGSQQQQQQQQQQQRQPSQSQNQQQPGTPFNQAFDTSALEGLTPNFSFNDQQSPMMNFNFGQQNLNPSAYFMPFNIDPPNFPGGMGDELGAGALDGMDFGFDVGMGVSPNPSGSSHGGGQG